MLRKCIYCYFCEREAAPRSQQSKDYPWEIYTLKELLHATNNFLQKNKLGDGGFGTVYLGRTSKGVQIAVKRLKALTEKAEIEFAVEVEMLGRVRHKNLLGLRGYCAREDELLIVYDYMPNHSLAAHLHGSLSHDMLLDWPRRMRIAIGTAEGLAYLHNEVNPPIIHRDIKSSNVLLDSEFQAKVADFGFAKLIPEGVTHLTTRVKGTPGYVAPEYAQWGKVSKSCDVFSFGILLFEIISGRKPIEKLPGGKKRDIVQWVYPLVANGCLECIVDTRLGEQYDRAQLKSAVAVAMRCVNSNRDNRPTMTEVLEVLKGGGYGDRTKEVIVIKDITKEGEEDDEPVISEPFQLSASSWRTSRTG